MPEFKPDKAVKTKIISLIVLWGKNLESGKGASQLHRLKIKTREVIRMLNALPGPSLTFDILKKYWENIPAIQKRIADLNRDTVTYRTEKESPDQVPETPDQAPEISPETPDQAPEPPADVPVDQTADGAVEPPGQTTTDTLPQPPETPPQQDQLVGSRSIVSQMAKRAKSRAIR